MSLVLKGKGVLQEQRAGMEATVQVEMLDQQVKMEAEFGRYHSDKTNFIETFSDLRPSWRPW